MTIKTIKWNTTISALVCIGAGIALFVWPELFTLMACRAIAMLLVVVGVVHLLSYLLERREAFRQQADLAIGAVLFALGLLMTLSPGFFISLIPLVLGAVVLVHGIQDIRYGLSLKKTAYEYWWSAVIFGIFSVLFGLTMIANPFGSASALTMLVGVALLLVGGLALIAFIVFINDAERRIPVQYAKRQVGRKMYGGQSSNLPMKVGMAGVLPVIFAQSIASLPITVWSFIGIPAEGTVSRSIYNAIDARSFVYIVVYFIMIIGFSYFYSSIQFNPVEIANNLKKQGGFIPGFRPGKPTVDFIKRVLNKVTLFGAIYLAIVAICPILVSKAVGNSSVAIGGTSVIIVVGVALETVKALESQMLMRQYKGFLE